MGKEELIVIGINLSIVLVAYFLIYPKCCKHNGYKIAFFDFLSSGISLLIVGTIYWNTGEEFNIIFSNVNWAWFTTITYVFIESPIMYWYYKKHDIWNSM